jgi:tRNA A37 N6-isopentenylltransferase MiaA
MHSRGKTPILVGGTMLYFKSLLEGLADNLPNADQSIRDAILAKADLEGWQLFMMNWLLIQLLDKSSKFQINNELFGH